MTEQPENQPGETTPGASPSWVPSDPEKGEPATSGDPTVVKPPVDPSSAADPAAVAPVPPPLQPAPPAPALGGAGAVSADSYRPENAASDRPEIAVGAAFAGGFVFAMILKRLAR